MVRRCRHRLWLVSLGLVVTLAGTLTPASSQPVRAGEPDYPDLAATMDLFGIDEETALSNIEARDRLNAVLTTDALAGYAGVKVDFRGELAVDYYFTGTPPGLLVESLAQQGLLARARFHRVSYSWAELAAIQAKLVRPAATIDASPDIDIAGNRLLLNAATQAEAAKLPNQGLTGRQMAAVVANVNGVRGEATAGGGGAMSTCTAGFVVKKVSNGNLGVSTAGHCPNPQNLSGVALTFKGELWGGQYDLQWHDAPGMTWTNTVSDGIADSTPYFRWITSKRAESQQFVGDPVCKTGKTTGYGCGELISKSQCPLDVPNRVCNFHRVYKNGVSLSQDGDSGGPVFYNDTALGLIHGRGGNDLIYMPQNRLGQLDLAVIVS